MKQLLLIIVLGYSFQLSAQYDPAKINKKAIKSYESAVQYLQDGLIKGSIPMLEKAVEYDANYVDAYLSLASVYNELKDYEKSVSYYEKARAKDTAYFRIFSMGYSISLAGMGKFKEALDAINTFLSIPKLNETSRKNAEYSRSCYQFALDYAARHPENNYVFAPVNLGDSINSPKSEYYPSFTIDDSLLVYTRKEDRGIQENFLESTLQKGYYTKAKLIEGAINEEPAKGAINISQDGEWLIFAGNFPGKGYGNFDLYISYLTPDGWSEPVNMGRNINTEFWESAPSLSPDKNALYFSSDRPGGYGGKDLYVSYRQPDGKWSKAVNMGAHINTNRDEQAPFIHADNRTLYFTSDGLPGYGGTDLFLIRKSGDNQWSVPENLGYPVNTIENEGTLYVAANGITAYYASDRSDSRGGLDLYKFDLRPDVRPVRTLYVKGKVSDAKTHDGLPCTVELINNNTQKPETKVQTDKTGQYLITLPVGADYTFTVNKKGYLFYSDIYALSTKTADSTYYKDIPLQPVELNATMTFKNIQYATNSSVLEPVSKIELDKLVQLLQENPTIHVQISGHTDNVGNDNDNLKLSANRAKSVVDYIVSKGIDASRLTSKGYGESKPIADNKTEEGKALNRRTECTVTGL